MDHLSENLCTHTNKKEVEWERERERERERESNRKGERGEG